MRAVVVVHYRTPDLLEECLEQIRTTWSRAESDRLVVVDNSEDPSEAVERVRREGASVLRAGNLGYAGAINHAVRSVPAGTFVVMNPDVLPQAGCVDRLFRELDAGTDVCGPSLFWDRTCTVRLPPADRLASVDLLLSAAATRWPLLHDRIRRRYRQHAHRHWRAAEPLASVSLSGAILAFRRRAVDLAGPWDEGFRLYFEETDWLRRCRAQRLEVRYLPNARATHLYDQSPPSPKNSKRQLFEQSEKRFLKRHFERTASLSASLARRLASASDAAGDAACGPVEPLQHGLQDVRWVEWSPSPRGYPMAARAGGDLLLPDEISRRHPGLVRSVRAVDSAGRELVSRAAD